MNSLKKGNLQSATFIKDGQEVKQYIEANPQFKNVTIYDSDQKRLDSSQSKSEKQQEDKSQHAKAAKTNKEATGEEAAPIDDAPNKQRRKSQKM